jgi:organic radical activating enzyme
MKGCTLRCMWCSNPESLHARRQIGVYPQRCIGVDKCGMCLTVAPDPAALVVEDGRVTRLDADDPQDYFACAAVCPTDALKVWGQRATVGEVMREVLADRDFYEESGGGLTLSGGEALAQSAFAVELLRAARAEGVSGDLEQSVATLPGGCDEWAIGSAGVASAPSPFPRINAQRNRYLTSDYSVESQRAILVTEAYRSHQSLKPLPYLSLLVADCTEQGCDVTAGGARYNSTGVQAVGLGTVADGLAAIRHLVFDRRLTTGAELLAAMSANWEGFDYLYALVNGSKVPHYGNDDPYADDLARYAAAVWCREVTRHDDAHGGRFQPGMFSISSNIPFGKMQGASPDGRRAGEPLSDGIAPVHNEPGSHDHKGVTAIINSAARLDQRLLTNGALLNIRIVPSSLEGPQADDNLASLIRAYFRRGGSHLQIYVESREVLIDADAHPDKYPGLLVYVNGYSTLWDELGETLKREIIARSELSIDENTGLTPPGQGF